MNLPDEVRMSLVCDTSEKILDGEVQHQEGVKAELCEYCD